MGTTACLRRACIRSRKHRQRKPRSVNMMLLASFFPWGRTEGDGEKESLRQSLQMLQKELGDQQGLFDEVR